MSFTNFEALSKITFDHPAYLCKTRAIGPDDDQIFQDLKTQYDKINQFSNYKQRLLCSLICSILTQERLYFAMSKASMNKMLKQDENLGDFRTGMDNNISKGEVLAWLYNDVKLLELVQHGSRKKPSVFRINKTSEIGKKIVEYLLSKGVDATTQKEESINFITGEN